jgi:hypothetical protein
MRGEPEETLLLYHYILSTTLKPTKTVTNQIWLAYRKSERQSQQTTLLLNQFIQ